VRAHKGAINVQARGEDGGARFTITLPRANEN
jgi:signal transduction histidine kinase